MKNRDEASTVRSLKKNRDVNVNEGNKSISVKKDSPLVGNGTYGKKNIVSKKKAKKETKQANQIKLAKDVKQVFKKKFNKVK